MARRQRTAPELRTPNSELRNSELRTQNSYNPFVPFEDIVEAKIQDAMAAGAFDGLKGAGRPLSANAADDLAGDNWMGYKVLQNGGMLPEWLTLAREIETDRAALDALNARHAEWVRVAEAADEWERHAPVLRALRVQFETQALALRRKQDRFNHDAPSISLERPAIWVDHHLQRLEDRLRDAGAPHWMVDRGV